MALIQSVKGISPRFGQDCFLAENTSVIGNVIAGHHCSFWYNSVVRGDVEPIVMGDYVNVQDNAIIHCTHKQFDVTIGNYVTIAHNAIVHGCKIADHVLIGMGAIVMDGCVIEENCIIAAGAVVLEGTRVEAGSVYAGCPAKKVKSISPERLNGTVKRIAEHYPEYASWIDVQR